MVIGMGVVELYIPAAHSLKQKRSVVKGVLARLHKQFNVSCAEVDFHDAWQSAAIGIAVISVSAVHAEQVIERVVEWLEYNRPDLTVVDHTVEIIS